MLTPPEVEFHSINNPDLEDCARYGEFKAIVEA
jgi:hypothetical protein